MPQSVEEVRKRVQLGMLGLGSTYVPPSQSSNQSGVDAGPHPPIDFGPLPPSNSYTSNSGSFSSTSQQSPVSREVQDTDTVQHHLDNILSKDSPLMQRAKTEAANYANSRGLLSSSMAAGASMGAMIDRATPVAQQDASTYFNQGLTNQGYTNQHITQQNDQSWRSGENAADRAHNASMQAMQQQYQQQQLAWQAEQNQAARDAQFKLQAEQNQYDLARLGYQFQLDQFNVSSQYAAVTTQNALNTINQIQADPNLEASAKKNAVQNVMDVTNESLQWASTFYNTPLPSMTVPGGTQSTLNPSGGYQRPQLPTMPTIPAGSTTAPTTGNNYQQQVASSWITNAYTNMLGYPPNQEGMRYWLDQSMKNGWGQHQLEAAIRSAATASGEIRQ